MQRILDLYTDYLITQNKYATCTGLSDILDGDISHDKITRFLNGNQLGSKELWQYVKPIVKDIEDENGVLILDDCIEEKPYTDENEIVCWHYSHAKDSHVKGINILSCMVSYNDVSIPIGYEIIHKDIEYIDPITNRKKGRSSIKKNEHFRNLLKMSKDNNIKYKYILADNWFGAKDNLSYINDYLNKKFIIGIKSNRIVAISRTEKLKGLFTKVSRLELEDDQCINVWLKGIEFPMQLTKKIFINENGSKGVLYIVSNDMEQSGEHLYMIYQRRWKIELYHKSIKQNTSLAASPTKRLLSQANHIFASLVAFCKLEFLKIKTCMNHFAMKYKILLKANRAAFMEFTNLKQAYTLA